MVKFNKKGTGFLKSVPFFIFVLLVFSGCAQLRPLFEATAHDQLNAGVAERFSLYSEQDDLSQPWWLSFDSKVLDQLMAKAGQENFSVQEAYARMEQARLSAGIVGTQLWPTLNYGADVTGRNQKKEGKSRMASDNWSMGLTAGYEIDLWGRIRADQNKALSEANASQDDLQTALMTVTGELATKWAALISNRQQQRLFQEELALQKKLLGLVKGRFPIGQSTALDIYQQQQAIEKIIESLVPMVAKERALVRQITFLIGSGNGAEVVHNLLAIQEDFPTIIKTPKPGIPAGLLAARPDIRAAGLRLKASEWAIVAAKADRLPNLRLSASHTFDSTDLSSIFKNWIFNLGTNLAGPIFDGNRRSLEVKRVQALIDERLANYRKVVFSAIVEVEDALSDEDQYRQILDSLNRQMLLSEKTMREARSRYLNGSTDFLNVLKEELTNLQLQQSLILTKEKKIVARVALYRALGGSWLGKMNSRTIE